MGDNYWLDYLGAENAGWQVLLLDIYGWYEQNEICKVDDLSGISQLL